MNEAWLEEASEICATVSRQVHRKYAVYFDIADLRQELIVWCLGKEHKIREWLNPDQDKEDLKAGIKQLAKSLNREADRYCRTEKAKACGYETRDEAFYTTGMIEELLPHVDELEQLSSSTGNVRVSNGGSDPATSGNYLVSIIDVRNAMTKLDPQDVLILSMKYQENLTLGQIAEVLELSDSTISRRIHAALRRMSKELGGDNPWSGLGNVRKPSNREAQASIQNN